MESKRKGLAKSKLLKSLYRGGKTKAADTAVEFMANETMKAKVPPQYPPNSTKKAGVGFIIVKKDNHQYPPHQKPKVAFVVPDRNAKLESFVYGDGDGDGDVDEAVDAKAARYISGVQERFRLELVNSDRNNAQLC